MSLISQSYAINMLIAVWITVNSRGERKQQRLVNSGGWSGLGIRAGWGGCRAICSPFPPFLLLQAMFWYLCQR